MADKKPNPKKKNPGKEEWKKKYGSYTWYYAHNLDRKDLITGKTIRQIINEKAKKFGIDPAFLTSSLMSEGLETYDAFDDKNNPFTAQQYIDNSLGYPVSGVAHLGMDTVGNRKDELFRRGLLKKDEYKKNVSEIVTKNEDESLESVTSGDFKSLDYGIETVAAFHKMENDKFDAYAKKNGIDLTPLQRTFFRYVAYNSGLGNAQEMSKSYNEKGILKDHSFIYEQPYESWTESWVNANKRITGAMGLNAEEDFERAEGQEDWYAGTNNKQVAVQLEAQGLMGINAVKAVDKHREAVLAANKLDPEGLVPREADKLTAAGIERAPKVKQKPMEFTPTGLVSTKATPAVGTNANIPLKEVSRSKTKSSSTIKSTGAMAKKNIPEISEESKKRMVDNLMAGIPAVESAADGYTAHNKQNADPKMQALGKYQFVPKFWWKDITKFADENGYDIDTYNDFLQSPSLQDAFFRRYAETVLIPDALEIAGLDQNPANFSVEKIAVLNHFQGKAGATKIVTTGNERAATKKGVDGATVDNLSTNGYIDKYEAALGSKNIAPVRDIETMTDEEKMEIGKIYHDKVDAITYGAKDLNEKEKNKRIQEIQTEFKAEGLIPAVNHYREKQNEKNAANEQKKFLENKERFNKLLEISESAHHFKEDGYNYTDLKFKDLKEKKEFLAFAKDLGLPIIKNDNKRILLDSDQVSETMAKSYREMTGQDLPEGIKSTLSTPTVIDYKAPGGGQLKPADFQKVDHSEFRNLVNNFQFKPTAIDPLDESIIPDRPAPPPAEETAATETEDAKSTATETDDTKATGLAGDGTKEGESLLDQWGKNLREDLARKKAEGEGNTYDKKNFKKEVPFDAITGMALGITGMDQARDTKIPKRTEEVSEAYRNFASELAKKSKEGLPPAVEAAMKAQLAEGLQGGLANLKNVAGGNRALILGNLGGLQKHQAQGIVEMQLADYEAKERAFAQYGEAVKYQNDFNTRKDVANHAIDYQEALKRRSDGEDLANAGFAQMIEGLKYQKENGPGSINHQKKSWLEQEMWGFALDAKPDAPNSYEAFQKKKSAFKEYTGKQLEASEKLASLNPQQQESYNKFLETNPSERDGVAMVNYLHDNPDKVRMDTTKFAEAKERQDFGLMFQDAEKPITEMSKPEKIESPAITQIESMQPGKAEKDLKRTLQPMGLGGMNSPKGPEQSEASVANLEDPDDFEFALEQATENQLSYYNNQ